MMLGGRTFVGCLGHEGGALRNAVSAHVRRDMRELSVLSLFTMVRQEGGGREQEERFSSEPDHAGILILNF